MKRKKKGIVIAIVFLFLILLGVGAYLYNRQQTQESDTEEIVLTENQTLLYAKIDNIAGNEMTYTQLEVTQISNNSNEGGDTSKGQQRQNTNMQGGSRGSMTEGNRDIDMSAFDSVSKSDDGTMTGYTLTEATNTTMIPVGTDVYTKLGNTTTFARLANGDIIKMILERTDSGEEIVMKIWMVN